MDGILILAVAVLPAPAAIILVIIALLLLDATRWIYFLKKGGVTFSPSNIRVVNRSWIYNFNPGEVKEFSLQKEFPRAGVLLLDDGSNVKLHSISLPYKSVRPQLYDEANNMVKDMNAQLKQYQ